VALCPLWLCVHYGCVSIMAVCPVSYMLAGLQTQTVSEGLLVWQAFSPKCYHTRLEHPLHTLHAQVTHQSCPPAPPLPPLPHRLSHPTPLPQVGSLMGCCVWQVQGMEPSGSALSWCLWPWNSSSGSSTTTPFLLLLLLVVVVLLLLYSTQTRVLQQRGPTGQGSQSSSSSRRRGCSVLCLAAWGCGLPPPPPAAAM
jgi:hypothetical protein